MTRLMPNLDRSRFDAAVVCIGDEGKLFGDLAASGTRAVALHRSKRQAVRALRDLTREMRNFAPDVVITLAPRTGSANPAGSVAPFSSSSTPRVTVDRAAPGAGNARLGDRFGVCDTVTLLAKKESC